MRTKALPTPLRSDVPRLAAWIGIGLVSLGMLAARASEVARFDWVVPATARDGEAFGVELRAVDAEGALVTDFAGPVSIRTAPSMGGRLSAWDSPVLFSEIDSGTVDRIEIQNTSTSTVDLTGWTVDFYDKTGWPRPTATWAAPAGMLLGSRGILRLVEGILPNPTNGVRGLGISLAWGEDAGGDAIATRPLAVMMRNARGQVVDFFAAHGAMPSEIREPVVLKNEDWPGFPMSSGSDALSFQRRGIRHTGSSEDWELYPPSYGTLNPHLRIPFLDSYFGYPTPDVSGPFVGGVWKGTIAVHETASDTRLVALGQNTLSGLSPVIDVLPDQDLRIEKLAADLVIESGRFGQYSTVSARIVNDSDKKAVNCLLRIRLDERSWPAGTNKIPVTIPPSGKASTWTIPTGRLLELSLGEIGARSTVDIELFFDTRQLPRYPLSVIADVSQTRVDDDPGNNRAEVWVVPRGLDYPTTLSRPSAWWELASGNRDHCEGRLLQGRTSEARSLAGITGVRVDLEATGISTPTDPQLAPSVNRAYSAWAVFRADGGLQNRQVLVESPSAIGDFRLVLRNGRPALEAGQTVWQPAVGLPDLRDEAWHRVRWWRDDGATNGWKVAVDGSTAVPLSIRTTDANLPAAAAGVFRIGGSTSGIDEFRGWLSKLAIHGSGMPSDDLPMWSDTGLHGPPAAQVEVSGMGGNLPGIYRNQTSIVSFQLRCSGMVSSEPGTIAMALPTFGSGVDWVTLDGQLAPFQFAEGFLRIPVPSLLPGTQSTLRVRMQVPSGLFIIDPRFPEPVLLNWMLVGAGTTQVRTSGMGGQLGLLVWQPDASWSRDMDQDGIKDDWEGRHGLSNQRRADALSDADGDGYTALEEFEADTDPNDPASFPKLNWQSLEPGKVEVLVPSRATSDYELLYRPRLDGPGAWERVEFRMGTGELLILRDNTLRGATGGFYRVRRIQL